MGDAYGETNLTTVMGHPASGWVTPAHAPDRGQGYGTMTPRRWLKRRRMKAMILSLANRTFRFAAGTAFKRPRLIGRMARGLKDRHRIARIATIVAQTRRRPQVGQSASHLVIDAEAKRSNETTRPRLPISIE